MQSTLKRKLAIAAAPLAAVAFAGGAYAATNSTNPRQQFLNDVAGRLHVSPEQLQSALKGAFTDQLAAAVKAGKITQARANAIKQRIAQGKFPLGFGRHPLGGPKHRFFGGPGGFGGPGRFGPGGKIGVVSKYLNLTPKQIFSELRSGKSLAQIATEHGKTAAGLKTQLANEAKARLGKAVSNKLITSSQEQLILGRLSSRLDTLINRKGLPAFRAGGPGGPGGPGGRIHGFRLSPDAPVPAGPPPAIVY
jgi:AraC-like DNA-binding protein